MTDTIERAIPKELEPGGRCSIIWGTLIRSRLESVNAGGHVVITGIAVGERAEPCTFFPRASLLAWSEEAAPVVEPGEQVVVECWNQGGELEAFELELAFTPLEELEPVPPTERAPEATTP